MAGMNELERGWHQRIRGAEQGQGVFMSPYEAIPDTDLQIRFLSLLEDFGEIRAGLYAIVNVGPREIGRHLTEVVPYIIGRLNVEGTAIPGFSPDISKTMIITPTGEVDERDDDGESHIRALVRIDSAPPELAAQAYSGAGRNR